MTIHYQLIQQLVDRVTCCDVFQMSNLIVLFLLFTVYPNHVKQTHLLETTRDPLALEAFFEACEITLGCLWYYNGNWKGAIQACKIPAIVGSDFELVRFVFLHICTFDGIYIWSWGGGVTIYIYVKGSSSSSLHRWHSVCLIRFRRNQWLLWKSQKGLGRSRGRGKLGRRSSTFESCWMVEGSWRHGQTDSLIWLVIYRSLEVTIDLVKFLFNQIICVVL